MKLRLPASIAFAVLALAAAPARAEDAACARALDTVYRDLRSGTTVPEAVMAWAASAEARQQRGAPCPPLPAALAARAGISPEEERWQQLRAAFDAMPYRERVSTFGLPGQSTYVPAPASASAAAAGSAPPAIPGPSALEEQAMGMGDDKLLALGRLIQLRGEPSVERYCRLAPPADCRTQRSGLMATRADHLAAQTAAATRRTAARSGTAPSQSGATSSAAGTGSQIVTVRNYDRNGNYLGTTTTTRTDAALMGK